MVLPVNSPGGAGSAVKLSPKNFPRIGPEQITLLRYKLDPGELGLLKSSTPGKSQLAVAAQELGNLREFERRAAMRGEVVVHKQISFKRSLVDGQTAVVAGRTEVYSRPPLDSAEPTAKQRGNGKDRTENNSSPQETPRELQTLRFDEAAVRADLERRFEQVLQEKVRLEKQIQQLESQTESNERMPSEVASLGPSTTGRESLEQAQARREKLWLDIKRQQLRRELARLEAMRTGRMIEELTRTLTNAILENAKVGHKLGRASLIFHSLSASGGITA